MYLGRVSMRREVQMRLNGVISALIYYINRNQVQGKMTLVPVQFTNYKPFWNNILISVKKEIN